MPGPLRSAWVDAEGFSQQLDELLLSLVAAAEILGTVIVNDDALIALVVANRDDLHRRRLWNAFVSANPAARQRVGRASENWRPQRSGTRHDVDAGLVCIR